MTPDIHAAIEKLVNYTRENPSMLESTLESLRREAKYYELSLINIPNEWDQRNPKVESTPTVDFHSPKDWSKVNIPPIYTGTYTAREGSGEIRVPDAEDRITTMSSDATVIVNFLNDCLARVNANEFVRKTSGTATDLWFMITGVCQNGLTGAWAKRIAEAMTHIYNTFGTSVVNKEPAEFEAVIAILKRNFEPVAPVTEEQPEASEPAANEQVKDVEKILVFLGKWLSLVTTVDSNNAPVVLLHYAASQFKQTGMDKQAAEEFLKVLKSSADKVGEFYIPDLDDEYKETLAILTKYTA